MKRLKVTVEGTAYQVTVEPLADDAPEIAPTQLPAAAPAPLTAAPLPATGGAPVPSPLAGKVVSIDAKQGQSVNEGDQLMVLEAMKMNTYIYAPKSGQITSIEASEGETVEEGQTLLNMA